MAASVFVPPPSAVKCRTESSPGDWARFKLQFQHFMIAADLEETSDARKTSIFLSLVGSEAFEIYQSFTFTTNAERQDVDVIIQKFDNYFIGEKNVTYERYVLNNRSQEMGEKFDEFLMDLRKLIKSCDYGEITDSIIRDRIVCGIADDVTRRKLLQTRNLDLNTAIDICKAAEMAGQQMKSLKSEDTVHAIHKPVNTQFSGSRRGEYPNRGRGRSSSHVREPEKTQFCKFCGSRHVFKKNICPAFGKKCNKCNKYNHFAKQCKLTSYTDSAASCKALQNIDKTNESNENVFMLQSKSRRKIFAKFELGRTMVEFQLDSGATCNCLSSTIAEQAFGKAVKFIPTSTVLRAIDNKPVPTVGILHADIMNCKTHKCYPVDFYVTKQNIQPVLGLETCEKLELLSVNEENIAVVHDKTLLAEFSDIFEGYGKLSGELHLQVDPDVCPVKMPVRKLPVCY